MPEILEYKCPGCGAPIKFDNKKDQMSCEFCGGSFDLATLQAYATAEKESRSAEHFDWSVNTEREQLEGKDFVGMTCSSCGAEIIGDSNTAATECPYCGNTNIISKQISGIYKPDCLIPFNYKKEDAKTFLREYYKGKWPLPKDFIAENRIDSIQGVYVPFWLFDGKASGEIEYAASTSRKWETGDKIHTETDHYQLQRQGSFSFEKIPVDGSSKMEDKLMDAIEPFNYKDLKDFAAPYLSGYLTDKYDVDQAKSVERANKRVHNTAVGAFRTGMDKYDSVSQKSAQIDINEGEVKYALFPVWLLTTKYKGKPYTFAVNGQTGKLAGDLPIDKGKLYSYRAAFFAVSLLGFYHFFKIFCYGI